jgi:hypothetical protein
MDVCLKANVVGLAWGENGKPLTLSPCGLQLPGSGASWRPRLHSPGEFPFIIQLSRPGEKFSDYPNEIND